MGYGPVLAITIRVNISEAETLYARSTISNFNFWCSLQWQRKQHLKIEYFFLRKLTLISLEVFL